MKVARERLALQRPWRGIRKPTASAVGKLRVGDRVPRARNKLLTENKVRIVSHARMAQDRDELLFKAAFLMVPRLLGYVIHHGLFIRRANTKGAVSLLPCEG